MTDQPRHTSGPVLPGACNAMYDGFRDKLRARDPVGATPNAEEVARMLYNADEWSGCNGSRWEVMPGHFQHERICAARDFLDALTAHGYVVVRRG